MDATIKTVNVDVKRYDDGETVGSISMRESSWEQYARCEHPAFQWPQGIAFAKEFLSDETIERMGLDEDTVIWLED